MAAMTSRPAAAGRVFLALAVSAAIHAALLLPPGAPRADANIEEGLPQAAATGLPLQLTLHAAAVADPETPAVVEAALPPQPPASVAAGEKPQTISLHETAVPTGNAVRYYLAQELDVRPQILSRVNPDYPRTAAEQGITANLVIRIYIDESGRVEKVTVPGNGTSSLFANAVSTAFMKAAYTPGIKDGKPVKSLVLIEVNFETLDEAATFRGNRY